MTETPSPAPPDLRYAFALALEDFAEWDGGPEPIITYEQRGYSIGAICDFTAAHSGEALDSIYKTVCILADKLAGSPEALDQLQRPTDRSYRSVAECMHRFYIARKSYYDRRTASRKT
jgi:hypothetical protein